MSILRNLTEPADKMVIQEFKSQLMSKLGSNVILVQLFGSHARGDFRKDSDIDILVVLKEATEAEKDFIDELVMKFAGKYEVFVSAVIWSKKEFEYYQSIPTLLIRNILGEGLKLT